MLRIKGRATAETIATVVGADVTAAIEQCETGRARREHPTRLPHHRPRAGAGRRALRDEREQAEPIVLDVYETFLPINDEVKQIVTDWQMRVVDGQIVLNDHQDREPRRRGDRPAARDRRQGRSGAGVVGRRRCRASTRTRRRLQRALAEIRDGDHTMVAAPIKDSYHTVWFELHEDLLLLSGRERTEG